MASYKEYGNIEVSADALTGAETIWVRQDSETKDLDLNTLKAFTFEIAANNVIKTSNTGSIISPVGLTSQRDISPSFGYLRGNANTSKMEFYGGSSWKGLIDETCTANSTVKGITQKATSAEAITGTNDEKYITPSTLKSVTDTLDTGITVLSGSIEWNPSSITYTQTVTTTVTVTGADYYDIVFVEHTSHVDGMILTGYVSDEDEVTVKLNTTSNNLDVPNGMLYVKVIHVG
jgi:hypothetical protein